MLGYVKNTLISRNPVGVTCMVPDNPKQCHPPDRQGVIAKFIFFKLKPVRSTPTQQNVPELCREIPSCRAEASARQAKATRLVLGSLHLAPSSVDPVGRRWPRSHLFPNQEQPSVAQPWPAHQYCHLGLV